MLKHLLLILSMTGGAQAQDCTVSFATQTSVAIGTLPAGSTLTGETRFQVYDRWQQSAETASYYVNGVLDVTGPNGGTLSAHVTTVHVTRAPWTADHVAFDVTHVTGDLGGEVGYVDPLLITLIGPPGALRDFEIPSGDDWLALRERRSFQVHTLSSADVSISPITEFAGDCLGS